MADVFTPQKRSEVMSRIRGRDTKLKCTLEPSLASRHIEPRRQKLMGGHFGLPNGTAIRQFGRR